MSPSIERSRNARDWVMRKTGTVMRARTRRCQDGAGKTDQGAKRSLAREAKMSRGEITHVEASQDDVPERNVDGYS